MTCNCGVMGNATQKKGDEVISLCHTDNERGSYHIKALAGIRHGRIIVCYEINFSVAVIIF